ncbi:MAG: endopeptidase La [Chlamydiae bacterium]|nr:endopeptidase La [Chlamydiota bacterium]
MEHREQKKKASKKQARPKVIKTASVHVLPLTKRPFFPGMAASLTIEPGPFYEALKSITKSDDRYVALCLTKKENIGIYSVGYDDLHPVGVLAKVLRVAPIQEQGAQVFLSVECRITLKKPKSQSKPLKVQFEPFFDQPEGEDQDLIKAYSTSILTTTKELLKLNPLFKEELQVFLGHSDFTDPGRLADYSVALTTATRDELQDVLEAFDLKDRSEKALQLLKKELDLNQLQNSITQKIEANITKSQKEYFLKEQLKTIKKELGLEKDDKTSDVDKFEKRIEKLNVPTPILKTIHEELDKLAFLDIQSAEYGVCRNYLDWLTLVPWGLKSKDIFDVDRAKGILDKDHYGLDDVKERILEIMAVSQLSRSTKGKIICLVGPPGVGKTSIGKCIASALNRKFYRFSVGGMRDEAEIKGHRRTYVGAMPGKLVQALKVTKTMNPVILIDEIDKIGNGHYNPSAALLEVLDPEQNCDFMDHYLDVPLDLSNILFIVTANTLDSIPTPLLDRMDVIRLSGYILEEKVAITEKYLIPKARKEAGLKANQIKIQKGAVVAMIDGYAREAGVRNLEKLIQKLMGKAAKDIVTKKKKNVSVTEENLIEFLKQPIFTQDLLYIDPPPGVVVGLAWTSMGGATLSIEAVKTPHADRTIMKLTGNLGEVMKESAQIAWTYFMSSIDRFAPYYRFFEKSEIHIHVPEGATPKDGPSAGITMVTALFSLLMGVKVRKGLGMTGEITVTGKVLPIGGVREKVIALRRSKLDYLILPKENMRDYDELPDYLKTGIHVEFVDTYEDVFKIAFDYPGNNRILVAPTPQI